MEKARSWVSSNMEVSSDDFKLLLPAPSNQLRLARFSRYSGCRLPVLIAREMQVIRQGPRAAVQNRDTHVIYLQSF